ncbi:tRNA N(3)-cytidine methyltransferase METTL6-like [Littorina saxatilis]|uniref:tRNA N(3)-cytidine methyltransferase METTL6 n=1 Tax=Littorina saxatilis TaxID=31220 RepID=A0AAN9BR79_9CAEN
MATGGGDTDPRTTNGYAARQLTDEELERLQKDTSLVSDFKQTKLEKEAEKNWDLFYKRNTTKFFKDRHWTKREFEELVGSKQNGEKRKVVFEVGCGVGNFMFPLLEEDETKSLFIYACDFSKRAVQFVKDHASYDGSRCSAFHADITTSLSDNVPDNSVDIATMIFVLSAIHPDKMLQALRNVLQTLKPGGTLLFRDYGLHDYAMLRFAPGHKLSDHFYVRQDGTRAFYFSLELLEELAREAGFEVQQNQYVHRETINKKEGICVPRIFVQAKFVKPHTNPAAKEEDLETLTSKLHSVHLKQDVGDCAKMSAVNNSCVSGNSDSHALKHTQEVDSGSDAKQPLQNSSGLANDEG